MKRNAESKKRTLIASHRLRSVAAIFVDCVRRGSLEHDPEKHALGLDPMGGNRFSEKIMLQDDG